ncbi:MAG: FdhF/YdeP family oxidoreductase [Acidobacteria bacterium]|nr:FdhF/YdeP family oxidoreductase [Acidobacteriota bacterium]
MGCRLRRGRRGRGADVARRRCRESRQHHPRRLRAGRPRQPLQRHLRLVRRRRPRWNRSLWVGLRPYGIGSGKVKPNHFKEMARVAWQNRRHPVYAWRILSRGACDGCALGVAGFRDWTIEGVHLCTTRLSLLAVNTADAIDPARLADVEALRTMPNRTLRALGRLGQPARRRAGEAGFTPVTWSEALGEIAGAIREAGGDRTAIYLTSRGITNEVYYVAGKAARAMGVASIDSAARVCHAPSTIALRDAIGAAATTCSFTDVLESDLVVLIGSNPANNQPVFMKYLYEAKRAGTKVAVVNPYLEPGLESYWVPSSPESALFGTKICDLHVPVRPGGDVAFCNAVLKTLIERDAIDRQFIAAHTTGWDDLARSLATQSLDDLLAASGVDVTTLHRFCDLYAQARGAILVWSMGITQHRESVAGVLAIVNLALARGNVGRDGAGLMPIRGHSGVQGGAEMGAYATALPGMVPVAPATAAALGAQWGFTVPDQPGLTATEMLEAAGDGRLSVLYASGGNFLDVLPDPAGVRRALGRVPLRVHQDIVLTDQMLVDPAEGGTVFVLPAATRYEQEGGGTETTTERRIIFSPQIPGHQVGEARSEWRIFAELAALVRPDLAARFAWADNLALRSEIAEVVPLYAGIERLAVTGDNVQWGGRHLARDGEFPTPDGRGRFTPVAPLAGPLGDGEYLLSTRRGKQFNSMVFSAVDPLNGAHRDDVLIDPADAARAGLAEGDPVRLRSTTGVMQATVRYARLPAQTLQVHWPEGNVLLPGGPDHREPQSKVPDYNTVVTIEPMMSR